MTCIDTTSKRHLSAKLAAGLAISVLLIAGAGIGTARADDDDRDHRGRGGWERQENHRENGHWTGGYYRAPPVVYAAPGYYAPPPAVYYGSGIGVTLPGINLNFR